MICILQIILINSQEELVNINANNKLEYAINRDFNIQLVDSHLIDSFEGYLSGARHIITITMLSESFHLITINKAKIQDINIQIISDILVTDSFSLIETSIDSQISNTYLLLNTTKTSMNINVSFFKSFTNSDIKNSFFFIHAFFNTFVDSQFMLAIDTPKSTFTNLNITEILYNLQTLTNFFNLGNANHIFITQTLIQCYNISGLAFKSTGTIKNIIIYQNITEVQFTTGLSIESSGDISQIQLSMHASQNIKQFTISGLTQKLGANLKHIYFQLNVDIGGIQDNNVIQLYQSQNQNLDISDISIRINIFDQRSKLIVNTLGKSIQNQEFKNVSIQIIQEAEELDNQIFNTVEILDKVTFINFYMMFESNANIYLGYQYHYGLAEKAVYMKVQNAVIVQIYDVENINNQFQIFGLFNSSISSQITNLSIRLQCTFGNQDSKYDNIFGGLGQTIVDNMCTNIVLQIMLFSQPQLLDYHGISQQVNGTTLDSINIYGELNLDDISSIQGISSIIFKCKLQHILLNIYYNAVNTAICNILGSQILETEVLYFVELTLYQKCQKDVQYYETFSNSLIVDSAILEGVLKGKEVVDADVLKTGNLAYALVLTGHWVTNPTLSQGFVFLKNLFTSQTKNTLQTRETPIFPFSQTLNGTIFLLNQFKIYFNNGSSIFDGNSTSCNIGIGGSICTSYNCQPGFCKNGGSCTTKSGCSCLPGNYGPTCESNFCGSCKGGSCAAPKLNALPGCEGDQKTTCKNGVEADNFCVCQDGYFTENELCSGFACDSDRTCNGQTCNSGSCICQMPLSGLSCQFCIGNDIKCQKECTKGNCQYGSTCVYLNAQLVEYQCSSCINNRAPPLCVDCRTNFIKIENLCFSICNNCKTGICYFLNSCSSKDPALCAFSCKSCNVGVSGSKCNICSADYQYYNFNCYQKLNQDTYFGVCFNFEGAVKCISCVEKYILYNNQCLAACSKENCQYGDCQEDQTCLCNEFFQGPSCDSCQKGAIFFNNLCQLECADCNGQCFYTKDGDISCIVCFDNYMGQDCLECQEGFIFENKQCLQKCELCNGNDCVIQGGVELCFDMCFTGYIGDSCKECDNTNGYFFAFDGCYKKCDTCIYGECFYIDVNSVICARCYDNRAGTQCNNCLNGFILALDKCQEQITEDSCYLLNDGTLSCISCITGKVLVGNTCLEICVNPVCQGTCYLTDKSYICQDCYNGFILIDQKCYELTENPRGDCYIKNDEVICICYPGFFEKQCNSCIGIIKDDQCFIKDDSINTGTCYKNTLNEFDKFCEECKYNYQPPLCKECSPGYEIDPSTLTCAVCSTGYINSSLLPPDKLILIGPNKCIASCVSCINGDCYYQGDIIFCLSCEKGYDVDTQCRTCVNGYTLFGSYCINIDDSGCGEIGIGEKYCKECEVHLQSFNCIECSLNSQKPNCYLHSEVNKGECYIQGDSVICTDESCLIHIIQSNDCTKCQQNFLLHDGSCWIPIPPENNKMRGNCYASGENIFCESCQANWSGAECDKCSDSNIDCDCIVESFNQCCCPIQYSISGLCYINQLNQLICRQCFKDYLLVDNLCVKVSSNKIDSILWSISSILILLIIIVLIILYFKLSKHKKQIILVKSKKIIKRLSSRLTFFILAQILSVIIAIQDVYINNFGMQNAVNIVSMIPILIIFFFSDIPNKNVFFFNKTSHYFLFALISLLDLCFNYIQFDGVPEFLQNFGEETYKLAGPPVTLFLTVFFGAMKFTKQQKISIFVGIALPLLLQFLNAITAFQTHGYISEASPGSVIYGQVLIGIAIVIIGVKFYLYEIILLKYGEMGSINRLAISALLVNAFVGCINPSQMIDAILDYKIFTFSVITQLIFNVINIIVMMHLSAVEFSINLISSAIWAIFITSVGSYYQASKNHYEESYLGIILNIISLVILLFALIYFTTHTSLWYSQSNDILKQDEKITTGVKPLIKSYINYRKQFVNATQQHQQSKINPIENMKALKLYDELKRSQTKELLFVNNLESFRSFSKPNNILRQNSVNQPLFQGSSLKKVVTCNKDVNVVCETRPIRMDTIQQLVIANDEAYESVPEEGPKLTFDQIRQKLKDLLDEEDEELVW
ncbi:Transmembrane domain-containing protein [Spironucleus salmonicida]|uniref:Transmembrane domain-containing protein n=1 Tax=Spironucleus salmonicida TaxID=348837 RepID=V6LX07_9EUKA|nr:Transmembrane domain-containing protein [Spironucleus salmonicida]|eukprot:EST49125.1 Transmembrane domain-containing protein [Spironucleus salmonicida]